MIVNYQKRKNTEFFKTLEDSGILLHENTQNYIPIYKRFFSLNETNYNSINLNNKWYISKINEINNDDHHLYDCKIKNITNDKVKNKTVFFKLAPLLDPYKYLIGKYNVNDNKLFTLPKLDSSEENCHPKFLDPNNSAYVDSLFLYLSSNLIHSHNFIHGVDYYGSFLGIKKKFVLNVFDDIDYLNNSDFFNKNKNILFQIEDYQHLFQNEKQKLKPITIQHNITSNSVLSIKSFDDEIFENIFEEKMLNLSDLKDSSFELVDLTDINILDNKESTSVTLKTNSTCSSRTSYTNDDDEDNSEDNEDEDEDEDNSQDNEDEDNENSDDDDENWEDDDSFQEEEIINATIPKFPVQIICMEYCENTFDNLILNNNLTTEQWYSAFMQIIMILITYQKVFNFTHNDLHTNNVMYNKTDKKFLYYCYKKKYYKIPTFGRLFKIIDFGRSIYKYDGKLFCSDSFQPGGDAATQYNIEPYFNEKKPLLEPNYSFDLCRLACSIFDHIIEDLDEIKDLKNCIDPVKRLIVEWCLDDKGVNMLYKNNGVDRYPDFKLYKMIARCVHNHTPQAQLERPEFKAFEYSNTDKPSDLINIDEIPVYV
jgi:ferredoxin-fold anticodon binding domain-containing protein